MPESAFRRFFLERFLLEGTGAKFTAAQREARNETTEQGKRPFPVVWACQHCCEKIELPDGSREIQDNIGDDDLVLLEDDDEIGLTFAYHVRCCDIIRAEVEFMHHRENGGLAN
jgi:hypothetical protein